MITKNVRAFSLAIGLGVASSLICATDVFAVTLIGEVNGLSNLYYDDWGHDFTNAFSEGGTDYASTIEQGEEPVAFDGHAFSANETFDVVARGCVVYGTTLLGSELCSGPNGLEDDIFRGNNYTGLIGIWSSAPDTIVPIEGGSNPSFLVRPNSTLTTPNTTEDIYLFLGTNNKSFAEGSESEPPYRVIITTQATNSEGVPEPSSLLGMFGVASLAMFFRKRL